MDRAWIARAGVLHEPAIGCARASLRANRAVCFSPAPGWRPGFRGAPAGAMSGAMDSAAARGRFPGLEARDRRALHARAPAPEASAAAEAAAEVPPVSGGAAAGSAGRCGRRRRSAACFGRRRRRSAWTLRELPSRRRLPQLPSIPESACAKARKWTPRPAPVLHGRPWIPWSAPMGLDRAPWGGRGFRGARPWGWTARHGAAVDSWSAPVGLACAPWSGRGFRGARPWGWPARHGAAVDSWSAPMGLDRAPWGGRGRHVRRHGFSSCVWAFPRRSKRGTGARHARAPAPHVRRPRAPWRGASATVAPARIPRTEDCRVMAT